MSILLEEIRKQLHGKPFEQLSRKGRLKAGFIDDFDAPIWRERFGLAPIKCAPILEEVDENEVFAAKPEPPMPGEGEQIDPKKPKPTKGKKEKVLKIHGVPIKKMKVTKKGISNPITPEMVIDAYKFFKVPADHFKGLKEIVISNELPGKKWAFGTYNIKKQGKKLLDNRITIWAQKTEMMNGEKRYVINPSNVSGFLFLTSSRFYYEILGDTIIHELGHHYDLWINESPLGGTGWVARAESFAERYTKSFTAIKRRSEEFINKMVEYGEADNAAEIESSDKKDDKTVKDVEMTDKR